MGIGSIVDIKTGKPVKYVPVRETVPQMHKRLKDHSDPTKGKEGKVELAPPDEKTGLPLVGSKYTYVNKKDKAIGSSTYIGNYLGGALEVNDGKKTCVAENYMSQLHNNVSYGTPVKFSYCYEDKQK